MSETNSKREAICVRCGWQLSEPDAIAQGWRFPERYLSNSGTVAGLCGWRCEHQQKVLDGTR